MDGRRDKQDIDVLQTKMLFCENGIAWVQKTLAQNVQNIATIGSYRFNKIRLARKNREVLISVNGVDRFDGNAFDVEGSSGLWDDQPFRGDGDSRSPLEARAGQHERRMATLCQCLDSRDIAVITVLMTDKRDIQLICEFPWLYDRGRDLVRGAQVEIDTNEDFVCFD